MTIIMFLIGGCSGGGATALATTYMTHTSDYQETITSVVAFIIVAVKNVLPCVFLVVR
jgi:large-conductance mechanosensitive channel